MWCVGKTEYGVEFLPQAPYNHALWPKEGKEGKVTLFFQISLHENRIIKQVLKKIWGGWRFAKKKRKPVTPGRNWVREPVMMLPSRSGHSGRRRKTRGESAGEEQD